MKKYERTYSRLAMGCVAVAITVTVIGLTVIMPASNQVEFPPAQTAIAPGTIEADITPARIEVFGVRNPKIISLQPSTSPQPPRQQG